MVSFVSSFVSTFAIVLSFGVLLVRLSSGNGLMSNIVRGHCNVRLGLSSLISQHSSSMRHAKTLRKQFYLNRTRELAKVYDAFLVSFHSFILVGLGREK